MRKSWTENKLNIILYIILFVIFTQRAPMLVSQFKSEGSTIKTVTLQTSTMQPVYFPKPNEKSVVVFWTTWCGPCSVELNRINKAILNKEIDPQKIYAVNLGEDPDLVKVEFAKRQYKFQVYFNFNKSLEAQLNAKITPTVAFIDDKQKLRWLSSGISPLLIYRIHRFLEL